MGLQEVCKCREIAHGISPFQPEKVAIQAGRIMLNRIDELIAAKENFAIETTLATRSYQQIIKEAKDGGYKVSLLYFWLNDVNLAIRRVNLRVKAGGHNIPVEIINRRYFAGIKNLLNIFIPIVDNWIVMNNSGQTFFIAEKYDDEINIIHREKQWNILNEIAHEKA